jgi:hypothetical protein
VANNNYPQITSVTSESLQAQIRNLLPSQEGFGTDLMAQNVIVPIIDLTSAAEGSTVRQDLQEALAFGNQTAFAISNTTTTIVSNAGFYLITGTSTLVAFSSGGRTNSFIINDGTTDKTVWSHEIPANGGNGIASEFYRFVMFLRPSETIKGNSNSTDGKLNGSVRQIADVNGVLVNPVGFSPQ